MGSKQPLNLRPMIYQVSAMTKVSECTAANEELLGVKNALLQRKSNLEYNLTTTENVVTTTAQELQQVEAKLQTQLANIEGMAEGKAKREVEDDISDLKKQKNKLLNRSEDQGGFSRIEKQMAVELIDFRVTKIDDAMTQITARKTELESVASAA